MPDPKLRGFLDDIYRSAKITSAGITFAVSVKPSLWRKSFEIISVILDAPLSDTHEACLIAKFVTWFFQINLTEEASNSLGNSGSDEEEALKPNNTAVHHKCDHIDVRRTVIDFGRFFTTGFVAGGSLRKASSVNAARLLAKELYKFSSCNHLSPSGRNCLCVNCAESLMSINHKVDDNLYAVPRFCRATSNSAFRSCFFNCRSLTFVVASIVTSAVEVGQRYFEKFESNQSDHVRIYSSIHQGETGIADDSNKSWLSGAQRTGEIFPKRPVVKPRLDFGASSKRVNARTCIKNYVKSEMHSPGTFTMQCVCSHPKIIGVSVMAECEEVSTALSVLVSRFAAMPRVCYYGNVRNLLRSIALRCPWVNDQCTIMCDRFHYAAHTCNSNCDLSSYGSCRKHATSGSESLNHL